MEGDGQRDANLRELDQSHWEGPHRPWAETTGAPPTRAGGETPSCFTAHEKAEGPGRTKGDSRQKRTYNPVQPSRMERLLSSRGEGVKGTYPYTWVLYQ